MAPRRITAVGSQVPPRSSSRVGARQPTSGRGHPTRPFAGLRSPVTLRAPGADVTDPRLVRTTTLPPKAPAARACAGSPPNTRLLLTGAYARRSRARYLLLLGRAAAPHAPAAEAQAVRRTSSGTINRATISMHDSDEDDAFWLDLFKTVMPGDPPPTDFPPELPFIPDV